jgi:hypothetical protein
MKTLLSLFLILLLSIPAAWAGSLDGKGIWCDNGNNSFGYWFYDNTFSRTTIKGDQIDHDGWYYYEEVGTDRVKLGRYLGRDHRLDRTTLKMVVDYTHSYQCYLVASPQELKRILQGIIDRETPKNKI